MALLCSNTNVVLFSLFTSSDGKSGSGGAVARNLTPGFSSALFPRFRYGRQ